MEKGTHKSRKVPQEAASALIAANWGRICEWLKELHGPLTIRQLSEKAGIAKTSIGNLESGKFGTQIDTLALIAAKLDFDLLGHLTFLRRPYRLRDE